MTNEKKETRDLHMVLVSEMTQEEWLKYREEWIAQYQHDLVTECGMTPTDELKEIAEVRWEQYCGQEGWTGRDERIACERDTDCGDEDGGNMAPIEDDR